MERCLKYFKTTDNFFKKTKYMEKLKILGEDVLCKSGPEASNLLWENLHIRGPLLR